MAGQPVERGQKENTAFVFEHPLLLAEVLERFLDAIADGEIAEKSAATGLKYNVRFFLADLCKKDNLHYRTIREFLFTDPEWSVKYAAAMRASADRLHMEDYHRIMEASPETIVDVQHLKLMHDATVRMGKIVDRDRFSETVKIESSVQINTCEIYNRQKFANEQMKAIEGQSTRVPDVIPIDMPIESIDMPIEKVFDGE